MSLPFVPSAARGQATAYATVAGMEQRIAQHDEPAFRSLALREIPTPDFADVTILAMPLGAPTDPATWARAIFTTRSAPPWVVALMGLRQVVVGAIGVQRAPSTVFDIREVVGEEALMSFDDRHLDFRVAVGVDAGARLVRVTTTVRLHGWRGRLYFAPVRLLHPVVVLAMTKSAARRLDPNRSSGSRRVRAVLATADRRAVADRL